MHHDTEYADGILQLELPRTIAAHWSSALKLVESPEEADLVLWAVWDWALCASSGAWASRRRCRCPLRPQMSARTQCQVQRKLCA